MIFKIENKKYKCLTETTYKNSDIYESAIENIIKENPKDFLGEDILIIGNQINDWVGTKERCDILGINKEGKLVVIEVKRDGDQSKDKNTTIQAIKYASYFATYTKKDVLEQYIVKNGGREEEVKKIISEFINKDYNDLVIDNDPKIILIGRNFPIEVTSSVLWLREQHNVDISCISIIPYLDNSIIYIEWQKIIPIPKAEDYMVKRQEKNVFDLNEKSERKKKFIVFIENFNNKLFQEIKDLENKSLNDKRGICRQYGTSDFHYEIDNSENEIQIGFHIENKQQENKEFIDKLYSENKIKLEPEGFKIFKVSYAIGIRYIEKLEEPFYILTPENIEKLIQKLVSKFKVLYETINKHVKEELWKETD